MEFALDEILTIIDKVKSTDLAMFEYRDADTKIRIRGTKKTGKEARADALKKAGQTAGPDSRTEDRRAAGSPEYPPAEEGMSAQPGNMRGNPGAVVTAGSSAGEETAAGTPAGGTAGTQSAGGLAADMPLTEEDGHVVTSPMVGTFYASASEKEEPFVRVGDRVRKGQTIGIVEAMKLMNEIESEWDGVVTEIFVKNEQMVEFGQPLIRVAGELPPSAQAR